MIEWVRFTSIAISTAAVTISLASMLLSRDALRRALRREAILHEHEWRFGDALARMDFEAAVAAYSQSQRAMYVELSAQNRHPWRPWTFWRAPPKVGEPWPDAAEHEPPALFN